MIFGWKAEMNIFSGFLTGVTGMGWYSTSGACFSPIAEPGQGDKEQDVADSVVPVIDLVEMTAPNKEPIWVN